MTTTTNDFTWWRRALECKRNKVEMDLPIDPNSPEPGLYRVRRKSGALMPVRYWYDEAGLHCVMGRENEPELDNLRAIEMWPYAALAPITKLAWVTVAQEGKDWPDIDPIVADQQRAGIGGNNPPTDPAELIAEQIASATAGADAYAEIKDDATAAKAQTLRSRLLELSSDADTQRETLKRPHLDAGKAVDEKWNPLVKSAKAVADKIRAALSTWETAKLRKAQAETAKAQAEAAKALAEAAKAQAEGKPAPKAPPPAPPPEPYVPTAVKGAAGRAASVKPRRVVTAITNIDALFTCLKNRPEVSTLFLQLAQKIVDANQDVLGVTIETQMSVK